MNLAWQKTVHIAIWGRISKSPELPIQKKNLASFCLSRNIYRRDILPRFVHLNSKETNNMIQKLNLNFCQIFGIIQTFRFFISVNFLFCRN